MTVSDLTIKVATTAALAADEKKAANIAVIDVTEVMAITEAFVIASADNERQVRAIVEEIEDELTKIGEEPRRREGNHEYRWVLLDYGNVIVHVQRHAERDFYGLDRLYRDCPLIEVEGLEAPERPGSWGDEIDPRTAESQDDLPLAGTELEDLDARDSML